MDPLFYLGLHAPGTDHFNRDQQAGLPPDQPISLQAVIALSDEALEPSTRSVLRRLSIFPAKPSSFDEQAAIAVSGGTGQELDRLVDAGLLEPSGRGRYAMHRTISDYSRTRADAAAPVGPMIEHFVRLAESNSDRFKTLNPEIQNILARCGWHTRAAWMRSSSTAPTPSTPTSKQTDCSSKRISS